MVSPVQSPGPLHYHGFRHAFIARVIAAGGSWMQTVAAGWLIYRLTGSAAAVAVLTVVSQRAGAGAGGRRRSALPAPRSPPHGDRVALGHIAGHGRARAC